MSCFDNPLGDFWSKLAQGVPIRCQGVIQLTEFTEIQHTRHLIFMDEAVRNELRDISSLHINTVSDFSNAAFKGLVEMINIKDDYEVVHGSVTEAAPKAFMK